MKHTIDVTWMDKKPSQSDFEFFVQDIQRSKTGVRLQVTRGRKRSDSNPRFLKISNDLLLEMIETQIRR